MLKYRIALKSSSWSRVAHADRRTDMTMLTVTFSNFANVPKKPPRHK